MTKLKPDVVLQRAPELSVRLDSSGNAHIDTGGGVVRCGSYGLTVLDVFSRPTPLSAGIEKIQAQAKGCQDWIDLTATVLRLFEAGVLREEGADAPGLAVNEAGFDAAPTHAAMLNDRARTGSYLAAIAEVVRPGDVVADLGTGTGILAMAAARAGARRVYAIEASGIGKLARANFEANGLADRIELVEGWSTRVTLPEKADVLVSEVVGDDPLAENVIEVTADARARLLKPRPRMLPGRLKVFGLPVSIPPADLAGRVIDGDSLGDWGTWYGFDFSPLAEAARRSYQVFMINPLSARQWNPLGDPVLLADIDFHEAEAHAAETVAVSAATAPGRLNGVLTYFELGLTSSIRLSTHPWSADGGTHWRGRVWFLPEPLDLQPGERLSVSYRYRVGRGLRPAVEVRRCA